jgi:hypothetical protein
MGWVIEIAKAFVLCAATVFVLAVAGMIFLPLNNSKGSRNRSSLPLHGLSASTRGRCQPRSWAALDSANRRW